METAVVLHTLMTFLLQGRDQTTTTTTTTLAPTPSECYEPYGCFPTGGSWWGPERPISLPPLPPHAIMPTFCLHTPTRPQCQELRVDDLRTIRNTTINPGAKLLVITHGYLESTQLEWMGRLTSALVGEGVGLITIDWSVAAPPPYAQAVANIRLIGAMTAHLLAQLVEEARVELEDIHLLGHSLGAHLMSYTSSHLKLITGKKVGRITGLDPAGPYFTNTPSEVRLDPSDGMFVDIIHTDIPSKPWQLDNLGYPDTLGHLDFYPNGGFNQAGCQGSAQVHIEKERTLAGGLIAYLGCDHQRAYQYFIQSVLNQCKFVGVACESWEEYKDGQCWGCEGERCGEMGFFARPLTFQSHPSSFQAHSSSFQPRSSSPNSDPGSPISPSSPSSQNGETTGYGGVVRVAQGEKGRSGRKRGGKGQGRRGGRRREEEEEEVVPIKVFFGTSSESPYCAEQYAVTVVTTTSPESVRSGGDLALFTVTLKAPTATYTVPPQHRSAFVEPGEQMRWVGWSAAPLDNIHSIQVNYEEEQGLLSSLIWRFSSPHLYVEAFIIETLSSGHQQYFPFCGKKMEAGKSYTIFPETVCDLV